VASPATIETSSIRAEPHVEIGAIIERDAKELVQRWIVRAKAEQPTAGRVHHDVLSNQLVFFLQATGRGLLESHGNPKQHRDEALEHGEQRWDKGWSLAELVRDYQILQLVILEHLDLVLNRPIGYREAMAVSVFINDAIAASIAAYIANRDHHLREIERAGLDALREAQARKDDFLALVVHELRNPLSPVVNAAEVLGMTVDASSATAADAVRLIKRQTRQLARILDDLTDLTRVTQGRLIIRREVVDVLDVVEQAIQTVAPLMAERGHTLVKDLEPGALRVEGDTARLVQVFANLLSNAAKYTPPSGVVTVIARQSDAAIEIGVRDTGQGIPSEMLESIFDMYSRVTAESPGSPDGHGIGLALVRKFVTLHGGTVNAFSEGPGRGAEFVVVMPTYRGTGAVTRNTPEPRHLPSLRILVVDDDPDVREWLATLLKLKGHFVDGAATATEAIERALGGDYDAAIVDIGLPDRSGFEVATSIRAANGSLYLVGMSAAHVADHSERASDAGFDAYLTKPADGDSLTMILLGARFPNRPRD
jgi:signal transduction histidine kinase/CheY-like chemotaxis protein